jgi:hypothetical protein
VLEDGIKIDSVAGDLLGVWGRAMIEALIAGSAGSAARPLGSPGFLTDRPRGLPPDQGIR